MFQSSNKEISYQYGCSFCCKYLSFFFFTKLLFRGREKMKISFAIFLLQQQIFLLMILVLLLGLNCLIEKK